MARAFDLIMVGALLPIGGPAAAVVAGAIALGDGGPVVFSQQRIGRGRKPFTIYKFRTMREGVVTPVGRVLRQAGLDELPQLWNVVRGDMALVGPRPLVAGDIARLGWGTPRHDVRWSVRPGIVGPVQIWSAAQCDARLSWIYDRAYVRRASVRRDLALVAAAGLCAVAGKARAARWLAPFRRWG